MITVFDINQYHCSKLSITIYKVMSGKRKKELLHGKTKEQWIEEAKPLIEFAMSKAGDIKNIHNVFFTDKISPIHDDSWVFVMFTDGDLESYTSIWWYDSGFDLPDDDLKFSLEVNQHKEGRKTIQTGILNIHEF